MRITAMLSAAAIAAILIKEGHPLFAAVLIFVALTEGVVLPWWAGMKAAWPGFWRNFCRNWNGERDRNVGARKYFGLLVMTLLFPIGLLLNVFLAPLFSDNPAADE